MRIRRDILRALDSAVKEHGLCDSIIIGRVCYLIAQKSGRIWSIVLD